jgi:hypothetical protein
MYRILLIETKCTAFLQVEHTILSIYKGQNVQGPIVQVHSGYENGIQCTVYYLELIPQHVYNCSIQLDQLIRD